MGFRDGVVGVFVLGHGNERRAVSVGGHGLNSLAREIVQARLDLMGRLFRNVDYANGGLSRLEIGKYVSGGFLYRVPCSF